MEIIRAGTRASQQASADHFTGRVWQDTVMAAPAPARARVLRVTFEPGARTAWHRHPLGQTLHVLTGVGLVGWRGAEAQVIQAGDTVWIPPGEEHWHGATPEVMMCHLAVQEAEDGRTADWLEQVSEDEYGAVGG